MEKEESQSCWGLTAKCMLVIAVLLLLTWLVGGGAHTSVMIANAG
jgi:hypothetical protein